MIEHIWKVVGVASTCENMEELRKRMHQSHVRNAAFQFAIKIMRKAEKTGQELLFDPMEFV